MIDKKYWILMAELLLIIPLLFCQLYRYKSKRISWKVFYIVYFNLMLQISAFLVLPLDILNVA